MLNPSHRFFLDAIFHRVIVLTALLSALVFVMVLLFVVREAAPAMQKPGIGALLSSDGWFPTAASFGLMPMLLATLATTAGAILLAAPIGIGAAVFSNFFAHRWVASIFRRLVESLAGIPSVVFGLWGLLVLVPTIATQLGGVGQSLLAGILVLALMIVPTVALSADSALRSIDPALVLSAKALGLGRGAVVRRVALPAAASGIHSGIFLALSRGVGETMAIVMVTGNKVQAPYDLLVPVRTLSANIALELGYAGSSHRAALFAGGLLLMAFIVVLLGLAYGLPKRRMRVRRLEDQAR